MKHFLYSLIISVLIGSTVLAQPVISSFSPASGPVGTSVTINGANFNSITSNNVVFFGDVRATVTAATTTSLDVTVPYGASYQFISVTNLALNQTGYSSDPYNCTFSCGSNIIANSFSTNIDTVTSSQIRHVESADIDGDGKSDLLASKFSGYISIYRNTSVPGLISYAPKIDFATASGALGIAVGDLDGDGRLDIAVVNNSSNLVSVYLNTSTVGAISFAPKLDYATATSPNFVVIGDLNADGRPELVVSNNSSSSISVFKNQCSVGVNSFAAKVDFTTGTTPKNLAIGDIDYDGKPDVAVACFNSNKISLLRNISSAGSVSFAAKVDFTTLANPYGVAMGDLDNDGKKEIAVSYFSTAFVSVFRNISSIGIVSLATKIDFAVSASPYGIGIADLNGDGQPDLYSSSYSTSRISVLQNTSTVSSISVMPKVDFLCGTNPHFAIASDADGDGRLDFITGNNGSSISFVRNTGGLGLDMTSPNSQMICTGASVNISLASTLPATYSWFAVDNPNTSGESVSTQFSPVLLDVITNSSALVQNVNYVVIPTSTSGCGTGNSQTVSVSVNPVPAMTNLNNASVPSGATVSVALTSNISSTYEWMAADNPNVTGESLIIQTSSTLSNTLFNSSSSPQIVTYTVTPTSTFGCGVGVSQILTVTVNPIITISSFNPTSGPIGTTVVISGTNFNSILANNLVFFGTAKATVISGTTNSLTVTVPLGANYDYISVTDVSTGLCATSFLPYVATFDCGGSISNTSMALGVDNTADSGPRFAACADFDGDGKPDVMNVNSVSNSFTVNRNTSTLALISTAPKVSFSTGGSTAPRFGAIGDLDGDGKQDVVVSSFNGGVISVYLNTSTIGVIAFAPKIDYLAGTSPSGVAIGDLDGDGREEIIVTNSGSNTLSIYKNNCSQGIISFAPKVDFSVGNYPYSVAIGDIDSDGKKDLAVCNTNSNNIHILKNLSTVGNLTFFVATVVACGNGPYTIAVGDLDSDGKLDLVTANYGGSSVSLLRNISTGSIAIAPKVDFTVTSPGSVCIADIDGDGKPDIATSSRSTGRFSIFKNLCTIGTISLATRVDYTTPSSPEFVTFSDIDLDGKQDAIVSTNLSSIFSIFRNQVNQGLVMTNASSITICSGSAVTIPLTSNFPAYYSWLAADNSSTTGESITNQNNDTLYDVINNNSSSVQSLSYTVVPTDSSGCGTGSQQIVTVNVNPIASMTSVSTASIPSAGTVSIPLTSNVSCTYTWIAIDNVNTIGESTLLQSSNTLNNTIINNTSVPQIVIYTVTPTATSGCSGGIPQTVNVIVNPVLTITSFSPLSADIGATINILGTNFNSVPTNNIVYFGGIRAIVTGGTNTSLSVIVPQGAAFNYISVTDSLSYLTATSPLKFTPIFTCGGNVSSNYFAPKVDLLPTGSAFQTVSGDLDGDGKNDIVAANYSGGSGNSISIFRNTSLIGALSFAPKVDLISASGPISVALADLNGDGKQDIIVGCDPNKVSVFINQSVVGVISFLPKVDFTSGSLPRNIAIGDIDSDGRLDIVTSNYGASSVSVLRNITSSISFVNFAAKIDFATGGMATGIALGDLDEDGKIDIVNSNNSSGTISVFHNSSSIGLISFGTRIDLTSNSGPQGLVLSDIDIDGKQDIVSANSSGSISSFKNNSAIGIIQFAPKIDFISGSNTYGLATGDLTGDGLPDMVVSKTSTNDVSVLNNIFTGTIDFASGVSFTVGNTPRNLIISDMDGDGKPEIITANSNGSGTLSILRNTAYYSPIALSATSITSNSSQLNWSAVSGAVDYYLDVAYDSLFTNFVGGWNNVNVGNVVTTSISSLIPSTTYFYRLRVVSAGCGLSANSNAIRFTTLGGALPPTITGVSPTSGPAGSIVTINGTNFASSPSNNTVKFGSATATIISSSTTALTVSVPAGTTYQPITVTNLSTALSTNSAIPFHLTFPCGGNLSSSSMSTRLDFTPPTNPSWIVESDFDSDGKVDVGIKTNTTMVFYRNVGMPDTIQFESPIDSAFAGSKVFAGDINGDGKNDLVFSNYDHITVCRNTSTVGAISFASPIQFATGNGVFIAGIYDLNGDGKPEITVTNFYDNTISILVNTGSVANISFAPRVNFNSGIGPWSGTVADIDGDSKLDVITGNANSNSVSVLKNMTTGSTISFSAPLDFPVDSVPYSVVTGNFSGLGKQDIAVVNYYSNNISVLKNTSSIGSISFAPSVDFIASNNPHQLSAADMDGDGKLDLVSSSNSSIISIFSNTSSSGTVSFATRVDFSMGGLSSPQATCLADLDGDGKPDMAVASNSTDKFSVLRNVNYLGATITGITSNSSCGSGSIILGATATAGTINWFSSPIGGVSLGTGNSFVSPVIDSTANYYVDVTFAGCTSIPRVNVVAAVRTSISSFLPLSGPIGTSVTINGCGFDSIASNNVVFFGAVESVITSASSNSLTVIVPVGATYENLSVTNKKNHSTGYSKMPFLVTFNCGAQITSSSFSSVIPAIPVTSSYSLNFAFGDLDNDGKIDVVKSGYYNSNGYAAGVSRNISSIGNVSFLPPTFFPVGNNPYEALLFDLNGDGKKEIITVDRGVNKISVLKNVSSPGVFSFMPAINFDAGSLVYSATAGDLDGDGRPDLVVLNDQNYASILRNASLGDSILFTAIQPISTDATANSVSLKLQDLNDDGKPELIFVTSFPAVSVSVYKNQSTIGNISFAPKQVFNAGSSWPYQLKVGDMDGDGKPDLLIGNNNSSSSYFAALRNTGSGGNISFAPLQTYSAVSESGELSIDDLNGDGKLDVAVSSQGGDVVSVFTNSSVSGTISFMPRVDYPIAYWPVNMNTADIDGDQKADLIYSSSSPDNINVMLNRACIVDDVWPGDANHDSIVNNLDLLSLGLYYSQSGPPRNLVSNIWAPFPATDWGVNQVNGSDIKHADCNGDGTINASDTLAINQNFSSTHMITNPNLDRLPVPNMYMLSSQGVYSPGDWVDIHVIVGDSASPVQDLYGLAFNINYDPTLVQSGTESLTYPTSWLSDPGVNGISFAKIVPLSSTAFGAETRIDHINANGNGEIANFRFQLDGSISASTTMNFLFSGYSANDSIGQPIPLNLLPYSILINPLATEIAETNNDFRVSVYPNPYIGLTHFNYILEEGVLVDLEIYDAMGHYIKTIFKGFQGRGKYDYDFSAKAEGKDAGVYFLKMQIGEKIIMKKLIELK